MLRDTIQPFPSFSDVIAGMLGRQFSKVETMLRDAEPELLAFAAFPVAHWKKIWPTNPLERLNKEIKRRTDVVEVFPNPAVVACQRDGTSSLPRVWDHLELSVSMASLVVGVNAGGLSGPVSLPVGGAFDDQGVCC